MTTDTPLDADDPDILAWRLRAQVRDLERDMAECRAALAERQAAIDELVAVEEGNDLALGYTKRRFVAWATARALATKEPQP